MAIEDVEVFTTWHYQPESESFNLPGAPVEYGRTLLDLTQGRFSASGGTIRDASTGRFAGRIATTLGSFLERGSQGTILLSNIRPRADLQEAMGTHAIPRLYIQGDLAPFGDTQTTPVNRIVTLAPRGSVIYVNDAIASGKSRYTRLDAGIFGEPGPPQANEFGHLASPEELIRRGVAGWLARNAVGAVERFKLTGYPLPDGTTTVNGSEIVRAIAANVSVTPIVTYVLGTAP